MQLAIRFGYAAQNLSIPSTTNRRLRLASLPDADRVRMLVGENIASLHTIIDWNARHGVGLFRIGQSMIPFGSHPSFPYHWQSEHKDQLAAVGQFARERDVRLSMHPGQYIQPGSPRLQVVENSLAELRFVADMFDLLGTPDAVMVLHLGGAYNERETTIERFMAVMKGEAAVLRYLALENDERSWTLPEVVEVATRLRVPAIVDTLHLALNPGQVTLPEALDRAFPTWSVRPAIPKVHISSQDCSKQAGAHAFGIDKRDWYELVAAIGHRDVDVMIEAKGKEQALFGLGLISPDTTIPN